MAYYIAYGSNLNMEQMGWRCPGAKMVGTAVIKDYRLLFKGSQTGSYLTIERARGHEVPVGVWHVTKEDEEALDRYEGYPRFYYKKNFMLECSDGKRHRCMVYIMHEDRLMGVPNLYYVNVCRQGYRDFGFNEDYLFEAIRYSKKRRGKAA